MEKTKINYVGIIGCVVLYAVTSFASAFIGFLNPWCWIVGFPVLAAVLGAPSYLWAASRWQRFNQKISAIIALGPRFGYHPCACCRLYRNPHRRSKNEIW